MLPSKDICWSLIIGMVQLAYMVLPVQGRSCGHLGEVTNGKYILEGVEFGARAAVTCDTGYTLVGSGIRNCLAEGWDGRVPVCEVVKCGKPPTIVNGGPVIPPEDEYSYRSVVEYSCEKEFTLVGTKSIVCEKDGEFQPAPPECKMVSCPAPVVENGVRIEGRSPPYKHKSYVMYKCKDGYEMTGEASLTCEIGGWSASIPTCKVVKCGKPPTIVNGGPVIPPEDEYSYRSVVEYSCEKEFTLVGTKSIVCEKDGEFQPAPPECKMVSCPAPVVENGVRIEGRSPPYKHKSYVMYKCKDGYEMTGEASLTCEIGGWSASIPTCKVVKCGKPPTIVNGGPVIPPEDEYSYRSVVEYSCEKEFTLVGTKSIVCEKDGEFQPAPPECKMVSCPAPVVENGVRIEGRSPPYKHKSYVMYKCKDGYEMTGEASLTCEIGGWSASIPTCKVVKCGKPPTIVNGGPVIPPEDEYSYRSVVEYSCEKEFTLVGTKSIVCEKDGEFQPAPPECKMVSCPAPVVENGVRIEGRSPPYKHKSYVMYKCKDGYEMTGEASLTCEIGGWSASIPTCKVVKCGKPPTIVNGGPVIPPEDEYSYRSVVEYSCEKEFTLVGTKSIVCEKDGEFQPAPPECKMVSCPAPVVENGVRIEGRSPPYKHKSYVMYKCKDGYEMTGEASLTCEIGGWSASIPTCKVVKCGKPPTIVNGGPVIPPEDEYSYRSVVEYSCEKEFTLVGTKSIVCEKDGEFQPAPPECKMVSCPAPVVENGVRIEGRSPPYKHKSFVTYKCNDGYEMTGEASLTCEIEGWSPSIPTCKVVKCGKPPTIVNGGPVIPPEDEYSYRSVVEYSCEKEFTLVGTKSIVCEKDGEFQPAPPECKMVSCPAPDVENGVRIQGRSPPYKHKSFVTYKCNDGYEMTGEASLTCEIGGWSPSIPTCKDHTWKIVGGVLGGLGVVCIIVFIIYKYTACARTYLP
ncbi:sushi, von Willebrand factor type A, EGF and pentraxin domain-containing protein 1-like isoform X3 [Salvelinus namaycush]|uniref:Sushi, von Willebrand factor type A, EGF and pentraxin domain-containing protein 1-like isoform X3 n=1 Tax=Salvelinus namaycush TaxID=8040 RepID=A0A8U1H0Q6_SALNM|nr:sushi, von Willebrand factor type A, EGF and pentraxin domain-containing protein 1-like isoform X3 [Salvelinus namaycush]